MEGRTEGRTHVNLYNRPPPPPTHTLCQSGGIKKHTKKQVFIRTKSATLLTQSQFSNWFFVNFLCPRDDSQRAL